MLLGVVEHDRGGLNDTSLEMLTVARELAAKLNAPLAAALIGEAARDLATALGSYGVRQVHLVLHQGLDDYAPEAWAQCVVQLIGDLTPQAVLAAGTDRGNEVMAHVAARTDLPLATNCTEVRPGDTYEITRVRWGGSLLEDAVLHGEPKLLTVAPHVVSAAQAPDPAETVLTEVQATLAASDLRVRVADRVRVVEGVSLTDARVVVGGGRGVGSTEGFGVLEELAELLGGAVGCSRAVTNSGWRPHADQVGQTGARIAPELYIACGISGAIQHWVGCMGSKKVLVINTDPQAPILAKADYAIIGDLHEVVPALIAEIRRAKQA